MPIGGVSWCPITVPPGRRLFIATALALLLWIDPDLRAWLHPWCSCPDSLSLRSRCAGTRATATEKNITRRRDVAFWLHLLRRR